MASENTEKVKRLMLRRSFEWVTSFDVTDYVQNPPLIKKLHEEKQLAQLTIVEYEKRIKKLEGTKHDLEMSNQRLQIENDDSRKKSVIVFILALLATILIGFGVNIVTSTPYGWTGWIMIVAACVLEFIAFINVQKEKR
jgi:hypothetical protein